MEMFDLNSSPLILSSVENLYDREQKVFFKSKKGEEKSRVLRITVEIKSELAVSVGKALSLQITDDNDSIFFLSLLLTQEDFSILKSQQGLLVDFDHFPSQLIKLLEACSSQELNKFLLVVDEEDVVGAVGGCGASGARGESVSGRGFVFLKVIETNNFKNLCHLSLKVGWGSEGEVRRHMSRKIGWLQERLGEEERGRRAAEARAAEAVRAAEARARELSEARVRAAEERERVRGEAGREVAEERERAARGEREWRERVEMEKELLGRELRKQISDLSEQISSLTLSNKSLYEAKCQLETAVKEKMFHVETLEKQNLHLTQEVSLLRKQNGQLDADYHEKDKAVVGLRTRVAVAEQELKDKGKLLEKQQELLLAAAEQKAFLEEALAEKDGALQKKMAAVQTLSSDLIKSNEIIAKLQTDLAANKAKMKLRTDIALEQEKIIEKKNAEMAAQAEMIREMKEKISQLKEEVESRSAELEEAKRAIEEKEVAIKKNENVISWLNRRLTECGGVPGSGVGQQGRGPMSRVGQGRPPWAGQSVGGGGERSQGEWTGINNTTDGGIFKLPSNSTSMEILSDQSKMQSQKPNESNVIDKKIAKEIGISDNKARGLDPKYFQSCTDRDSIANATTKSGSCSSRPIGGKQHQQSSAYFPKRPVPL